MKLHGRERSTPFSPFTTEFIKELAKGEMVNINVTDAGNVQTRWQMRLQKQV